MPGILKARLGVNEILTTVMMNAIALQFMNFMIRGPLIDPAGVTAGQYLAQSEKLPEQVWLMRLVPQTLLHAGIFVALALAIVTYVFLWRTTIGYRIRAVGLNPDASRYAGIRVPVYQALSLTLAGGLAGVAGAVEVIGVQHRLLDGITSGYGFSGIVTALFGGLHPLGTIPASFVFGGLLVGADKMQRAVQVPSALIQAILGLIVLFVVGSQYWARRRAARRIDTLGGRCAADSRSGRDTRVNESVLATLVAIAAAAIRLATPYLYASIGEMFAQRSGVLNLGVDGIMLVGAFAAFYGTLMTGSLWVGVAGGDRRRPGDGPADVASSA